MATYRYPHARDHEPLVLLVPGNPVTEGHWMNRWLAWSEHCRVIELGLWDEPHRNTWVNKLNLAIRRADRPVVVVTDDIAALVLAWWVEFEAISQESPVLGALIVNPPNVDLPGADERLARFGAVPRQELPFTSFLVSDLEGSVAHQRALCGWLTIGALARSATIRMAIGVQGGCSYNQCSTSVPQGRSRGFAFRTGLPDCTKRCASGCFDAMQGRGPPTIPAERPGSHAPVALSAPGSIPGVDWGPDRDP